MEVAPVKTSEGAIGSIGATADVVELDSVTRDSVSIAEIDFDGSGIEGEKIGTIFEITGARATFLIFDIGKFEATTSPGCATIGGNITGQTDFRTALRHSGLGACSEREEAKQHERKERSNGFSISGRYHADAGVLDQLILLTLQ